MKTDGKKLIAMVRKGIPDKDIMRELGIQTKVSLRKVYYDALVEAGKIRAIVTERNVKRAPKRRALKIGKRGTMLLSSAVLIDQLGFKKGDKFTVSKRKDSIILKKSG